MTYYLIQPDVLPGLQAEDRVRIQEPFYSSRLEYNTSLNEFHTHQDESMYMLIFKDANGHQNQQYVAHVGVTCTSRRVKKQQFTVEAFLTCQRFTYFPLEEVNFQSVFQTFLNIRVPDE